MKRSFGGFFFFSDRSICSPYQPHDEQEVASRGLAVPRCAAAVADSVLGEHLPPDDQLTHALFGRQGQQAVVLAVQAHVQQVFFRKVVGY